MTITTMPDALAAAVENERAPRERVADLTARLDTALSSQRYDAAAEVQPALDAARADLALAEATTRALREGGQAVEAQRAADAARLQQAQARSEAVTAINTATAAETRAMVQVDQALDEMKTALEAAQAAYRTALAFETRAGQERQCVSDARMLLSDLPPGHPGPTVARPNKASVLVDQEPIVAALVHWRR
jgi:hypothetical protein